MKKRFWTGIFSWFIIGSVLIFASLFAFMTLQNLEIQKEQTSKLLMEKGDALIRAFEAGARTGLGLRWNAFQLQKLLIETAQQPGIDYIIVIDTNGVILADSDPARVGEVYGTDLDLSRVARTKESRWRQVPNTVGADTFEVYRQFAPTKEPFSGFQDSGRSSGDSGLVIFVGLDMGPILTARKADEQHTIWIAFVLVLIGCSGFISLFLAYRYRATRVSLSKVQAFSDHLVENMPIGLISIDHEDRIATFNTAASAILELPISEALGRSAGQRLPAICLDMIEHLKSDKTIIEKEVECPVHGGKTVPLGVIASILEEDGETQGFIILFRDLTEIRHLQKEIIRSQRLAAVGSLAAGVAHEIRNPLSSIKGFATYFKERYRDIPEDKQTAEIMITEVERLNRVISQLLEFARPVTLYCRTTSLVALIRHSLKMIENQAQAKGIALMADDVTDTELYIDPDKTKQVLLNLFLNAVAAMENGGSLLIKSALVDNRFLKVTISDTGGGIPKEDLNRIFDPYFTTKSSGTGLGLAIVHKIMEAHNGGIAVESEPGQGTTVTLVFPLTFSPAPSQRETELLGSLPSPSTGKGS